MRGALATFRGFLLTPPSLTSELKLDDSVHSESNDFQEVREGAELCNLYILVPNFSEEPFLVAIVSYCERVSRDFSMSMCNVPFRVRRSVAASLDGGYDSPCCSSPSRDSSSQQLLVRRQQFKQLKKQSSVLQRSITMSGKKLNKMRSIVRQWKKFTHASQSRYLSLDGNKSSSISVGCEKENVQRRGETISCFSSSASASGSASDSDCSPKSVKHLARSAVTDDVPDGCLALFVGRERRRFVIGAHYLEHNLFRGLLERSAAEFGFDQKGGITIACEVVLFEHLLWLIGTDDPSSRHLQVDELLDFYAY